MSRPIPIDIVPSHVYLSQNDQQTLFGTGHAMTIQGDHTQPGQIVYEDTVEVFGRLKRSLNLRVLGPNWDRSHVEVTPTEAVFLGYQPIEAKVGDLTSALPCEMVGPHGRVSLTAGIIVPEPHLTCNVKDANALHLINGQRVKISVLGGTKQINHVIVRVHPMFRLRIEVHQDIARDLWINRPTHGQVIL